MGLHQKITDRITSEPCNCGADDDHSVWVDAPADVAYDDIDQWSQIEVPVEPWTDGTEASE